MGDVVMGVLVVVAHVSYKDINGSLCHKEAVLLRVECTEQQAKGYYLDMKGMNPGLMVSACWTGKKYF